MIRKILHLEGFAIFLFAVYLFYRISGDWLLFVILLLTPDLSMVGYLKNKEVGAVTYNLIHNYVLPVFICAAGVLIGSRLVVSLGLILLAHVGMDRFLGFGLKYPTHFKLTHLQKL